ncbi:MOFRL family protein [Polaromonas sp. CG_9.11]|uniref:MOFRL family protein n=1 Tax=Polaromonas sp. CG_9.11 TaxID=2787730 RepID=UPI0018C9F28B|nr:glycerate-2-kinase [Polaromonas sp. CG_9.11]
MSPYTLQRALTAGMKLENYLDRNDAHGYFHRLGDLVISGPTYASVNNFRALLIL